MAPDSSRKPPPFRTGEALRFGTCPRCGFVAKHPMAQDCINFLRNRLAEMGRKKPKKNEPHGETTINR
jgi:hypothetical protein